MFAFMLELSNPHRQSGFRFSQLRFLHDGVLVEFGVHIVSGVSFQH